jgi:hypothetical protein
MHASVTSLPSHITVSRRLHAVHALRIMLAEALHEHMMGLCADIPLLGDWENGYRPPEGGRLMHHGIMFMHRHRPHRRPPPPPAAR